MAEGLPLHAGRGRRRGLDPPDGAPYGRLGGGGRRFCFRGDGPRRRRWRWAHFFGGFRRPLPLASAGGRRGWHRRGCLGGFCRGSGSSRRRSAAAVRGAAVGRFRHFAPLAFAHRQQGEKERKIRVEKPQNAGLEAWKYRQTAPQQIWKNPSGWRQGGALATARPGESTCTTG